MRKEDTVMANWRSGGDEERLKIGAKRTERERESGGGTGRARGINETHEDTLSSLTSPRPRPVIIQSLVLILSSPPPVVVVVILPLHFAYLLLFQVYELLSDRLFAINIFSQGFSSVHYLQRKERYNHTRGNSLGQHSSSF